MKTKAMIIFVVALLFAITTTAIASNASELFGTIVSYVEQIQEYPAALTTPFVRGIGKRINQRWQNWQI